MSIQPVFRFIFGLSLKSFSFMNSSLFYLVQNNWFLFFQTGTLKNFIQFSFCSTQIFFCTPPKLVKCAHEIANLCPGFLSELSQKVNHILPYCNHLINKEVDIMI